MNSIEKMAYSPIETAGALGLCLNSVYKMLRRGQLNGVRVDRKILIPRAELERLLRLDGPTPLTNSTPTET